MKRTMFFSCNIFAFSILSSFQFPTHFFTWRFITSPTIVYCPFMPQTIFSSMCCACGCETLKSTGNWCKISSIFPGMNSYKNITLNWAITNYQCGHITVLSLFSIALSYAIADQLEIFTNEEKLIIKSNNFHAVFLHSSCSFGCVSFFLSM